MDIYLYQLIFLISITVLTGIGSFLPLIIISFVYDDKSPFKTKARLNPDLNVPFNTIMSISDGR